MWQEYSRKLIKKKLKESQAKNSSISMRSFANKLGLSSGSLSEILSGKRNISKTAVNRIFTKIELTDEENTTLRNFLENKESRKKLDEETFRLISEWHFYAIICLFELQHPPQTIQEIAERLNLSKNTVTNAIQTLVDLQILKKITNGWVTTGHYVTTSDEIPSEVIRKTHLSDLDFAKKKLTELPVNQRDFTATTFCGSEKQLLKAKKEIRKLHQRISTIMSSPQKNAVYKLTIQLYPLSKTDPSERS